MKKCFYIFILTCTINYCSAQTPPYLFQSLFGSATRAEVLSSITKFNMQYLGVTTNGNPFSNWEIDVHLINENGTIIKTTNISLPGKTLVNTSKKASINWQDTSIFITGRMAGTQWHGMLWKINKNLDTLWHKEYVNPIPDSSLQFSSSLIVDDGLILYGTSCQYDIYGDCFIMKVDFNGNELWRKTVQLPGQSGGVIKMIHTLDKSFISYQNITYTNTDTDYRLVKYDSLFNQIWAHTYFTPFKDYDGDIIETSDSNYVICNGYTDVMLGGVMGTSKSRNNLLKINKNNGTVIWNKKYGTPSNFTELRRVQEMGNGNLLAIGLHVTAYVGPKPQGAYVTHLFTTNSYGDSLSYQSVFTDSSSTINRLWDFCKTNTGYFFVGDATDVNNGNEQNWLIKSDMNICFLDSCVSPSGIQFFTNENSIKVYPNPANNFITIDAPYNQLATIKIIDMLGNTVFQQIIKNETNNINAFQLLNGSYILQFLQNGNVINKFIIINN